MPTQELLVLLIAGNISQDILSLETVDIKVHHLIEGSDMKAASRDRSAVTKLLDGQGYHFAVQSEGVSGAHIACQLYLRSRYVQLGYHWCITWCSCINSD